MFKFLKDKLKDLFKSTKEEVEVVEKPAKKVKEKKEGRAEELREDYRNLEKRGSEQVGKLGSLSKEVKKPEKKQKIKELKEEIHEDIETTIEEKEETKEQFNEEVEKLIEKEEYKEGVIEPIVGEKTEPKPEKKGFFSRIQTRFNTVQINQKTFDEFFEKLEMLLLENNVALSVVDKIREDMQKRLVNIEVKKDQLENEIKNTLRDSILEILIEPFDLIEKIKKKEGTFVILFFGINGSGKTTTIAKVASLLQKNKISSVLAAADTFRAASIEQLEKHGEKLGIKVIHQEYGSDPSAVAFDAIKYAQAHQIKVVLIDTAGRMHTKDNLLKEMEKIVRVTKPDLKIFVAESITGNDATEQAKIFNETANIDGSILTKADVDEKGGTAISIGYVTGKPILFLGTGQEYKDLEKFDPKDIIANLGLD
ncbi:MAG: signal recognition particle-docking protein FtsY [Candidatus Pacearchaeota archaeon]|jgi:fused signal recognition particle receptor